jgi:hypothetical protein
MPSPAVHLRFPAAIHLRPDGSVKISKCLIFCPGVGAWVDRRNSSDPPHHEIGGIYFVNQLPRWWQIRRWARLLRTIREYVRPLESE